MKKTLALLAALALPRCEGTPDTYIINPPAIAHSRQLAARIEALRTQIDRTTDDPAPPRCKSLEECTSKSQIYEGQTFAAVDSMRPTTDGLELKEQKRELKTDIQMTEYYELQAEKMQVDKETVIAIPGTEYGPFPPETSTAK